MVRNYRVPICLRWISREFEEVVSVARERLQWYVPEAEFARFKEWVLDKHGDTSPYVGFELEEAMREYLDRDDLEGLEDLADRLLEATGRPSEGGEKKENPMTRSFDGPTSKVHHRVSSELKERFARFADRNGMGYGEAIARVMSTRREGGRVRRIRDSLQDAVPEAVDALNSIEDNVGGMAKSERVEISIAKELGDVFSEADLADAINTVTSGTEYYHDEYTPRVIERKDVRRWERPDDEPDMFYPEETWQKKATGEILKQMGADAVGLSEETLPTPVDGSTFLKALSNVLDLKPSEHTDTVSEYRERIEERMGCEYNPDAEVFINPDPDTGDDDKDISAEEPDTPDTPDGPPTAEPGAAVAPDGGRDEAIQSYADEADDLFDKMEAATPER